MPHYARLLEHFEQAYFCNVFGKQFLFGFETVQGNEGNEEERNSKYTKITLTVNHCLSHNKHAHHYEFKFCHSKCNLM